MYVLGLIMFIITFKLYYDLSHLFVVKSLDSNTEGGNALYYQESKHPCSLPLASRGGRIRVMVFNNISVILWQSALLVEETRVPRENQTTTTAPPIRVKGLDLDFL